MKKLRKILLSCMLFMFALSFVSLAKPKAEAMAAGEPPQVGKELYASISISGQSIDTKTLNTIDGVTYVITNGATTLNLNYLTNNYNITFDNPSNFYINTVDVVLEKHEGVFPTSFTLDGTVFSYQVISGEIAFYKTNGEIGGTAIPTLRTDYGSCISYVDTETTRTITFTTSITLDETADASTVSYTVYQNQAALTDEINICFTRPAVNFNTDDTISFECTGIDVGGSTFVDTKIPSEHSYGNVKLSFTNNDYTESNPLYFDINHNGFVYTYKLFSKTIEADELLFVEYYDNQKPDYNTSLASVVNASGEVITKIYKYIGMTENFNEFMIDFNKTGRYEISVYDSTHVLGLVDDNYYSTSFYIKDESASSSAFDNVYVIFQTMSDEGEPLDYIVSESTLNNDVKINIKNLLFYFEKDTVLQDDDIVLDFTVTTFGGSSNIPVTKSYTKKELCDLLTKDGEFFLTVSEDAFYEITLYQWHIEDFLENGVTVQKRVKGGTAHGKSYEQYYNFSVVKTPKISYTKYLTNEEHEIVYDESGKPKTTTKVATVPYTIVRDTNNYRNIKSSMMITVKFAALASPTEIKLEKAYINNYYIDYAMQAVAVSEGNVMDSEGKIDTTKFVLNFSGIGDINVTIQLNGKTITKTLTAETGYTMIFEEYGVYNVSFIDSMGTTGSDVFEWEKPVSASAKILVILIGVLVAGAVLFVVLARSKMKTR